MQIMESKLEDHYSKAVNFIRKRRLNMKKTLLRSQELSCPSCVTKIESALKAVAGVTDAKVYFNTGKIEVQHDPQVVGVQELVKVVKSVGYEARAAAF
jgi:copper chaperone CopZ